LFGFGFLWGFTSEQKMTDSQTLLAEYAVNGSESAFRELVTRYINFVYSVALRLVGGDTHLAEDVTQTVFIALARKGRTLSRGVMLGGWLHQHTYHAATKAVRSKRRRQSREREAVEMNTQQDDSGANLRQVAPILDEAINQLGSEDRAAILLRFYEQHEFRSVGEALGSTEDAARMRVNRAVEKLHSLLTHRGVTLSVAALGTVLTAEAVSAAPVGLAVTISSVALASAAAGTGTTLTFLKAMTMTKLQAGIMCGIVVASAVTSLQIEHQAQAKMRQVDVSLQQQTSQLAQLQAQNGRFSNFLTQANSPNNPGDLEKLRDEVAILRSQTNELTVLQDEERRLQASLAKAGQDLLDPKVDDFEWSKELRAKQNYMDLLSSAIREYARNNQDRFPTRFEEAAAFLSDRARNETNFTPAQFEIVYNGSMSNTLKYAHPKRILLIRERQPWKNTDGNWVKLYEAIFGERWIVFKAADEEGAVVKLYEAINGQRWHISLPYGDFEAWEEQRIVPPELSNE
jgi:RNA polymerase sigma factor (sigma-70 family)